MGAWEDWGLPTNPMCVSLVLLLSSVIVGNTHGQLAEIDPSGKVSRPGSLAGVRGWEEGQGSPDGAVELLSPFQVPEPGSILVLPTV